MSASICTAGVGDRAAHPGGRDARDGPHRQRLTALAAELAKAGEHPEVVLEATYGWYWAADVLAEGGAMVHLAHPLGNNWGHRRVKNDERDATDLVDLLRLGRLAEAWIAPPELRELRELIRYRAKLVHLRRTSKPRCTRCWPKRGWRCR